MEGRRQAPRLESKGAKVSPIEKGDRVRVHADGDVVRVARTEPLFEVLLPLGDTWDKTRGMERERHQRERTAWFYSDEVEPTLDKPLVDNSLGGNGWRGVCVDMILEGNKDVDAASLLYANSPDAAPYIRLLERLENAFGALPNADLFREAWVRGAIGRHVQNDIDSYQRAEDAYRALRKFRENRGR